MLKDSACVRAILIDFTKAFDIAYHTVLMFKLAEVQLPGNIYNWIGSFLSARLQVCRFNGTVSNLESFNLGFVQGLRSSTRLHCADRGHSAQPLRNYFGLLF